MNTVERILASGGKNILVIGDGMTDIYAYGRMESTCQEGCPKFIEERKVAVPGGAWNASQTLKKWKDNGIIAQYIGLPPEIAPVKKRCMVGNKCVFRHDNDNTGTGKGHEAIRLIIESLLTDDKPSTRMEFDAILLSDYDKGLLTREFIQMVVAVCKKRSVPCVADCKRAPELYDGCILKGNYEYWSKYHAPYKAEILITNGPQPPQTLYTQHCCKKDLSSVNCVNHVGAGDCFAAHLTLALAYGFSLKKSAAFAHSAGRVYVQRPNNTPPHPDEIRADMDDVQLLRS